MKRVTLLCGLLLALSASVAAAGPGLGLRWSNCIGDGGAINKAFACNSNTGSNQLTGTFEVAADMQNVSGNEIVIDLASAGASLPAWWQFRNPGTCRTTAMSMNTALSPLAVACVDWGSGLAAGGVGAYNIGLRGPNTARIVAALAVPSANLALLAAGQEYFSFNLIINNTKTMGATGCAGCQTGVCIVWNSLNLTTPIAANNKKISGPSNGFDADFATWQGGAGVTVGQVTGCGAATPTKNATWGAVKSLYR